MQTCIRYALLHACSLMVILPTGWCCYALPKPKVSPVIQSCSGCCCTTAPEAPQDDKQPEEHGDEFPPTIPTTRCCCDQPSLVPELVDLDQDLSPSMLASVPVVLDQFNPDVRWETLSNDPIVFSPPLHILHCCWLC